MLHSYQRFAIFIFLVDFDDWMGMLTFKLGPWRLPTSFNL